MSQENNTTPSARNREAYAALTEMGGNVPPQAVELEEAVLGALMLEKDSIITVQEFVTPEAFYTEEHRLIYRAIEELSSELKPIDLYTDGLKIYTTLDSRMQQYAEDAVTEHLKELQGYFFKEEMIKTKAAHRAISSFTLP